MPLDDAGAASLRRQLERKAHLRAYCRRKGPSSSFYCCHLRVRRGRRRQNGSPRSMHAKWLSRSFPKRPEERGWLECPSAFFSFSIKLFACSANAALRNCIGNVSAESNSSPSPSPSCAQTSFPEKQSESRRKRGKIRLSRPSCAKRERERRQKTATHKSNLVQKCPQKLYPSKSLSFCVSCQLCLLWRIVRRTAPHSRRVAEKSEATASLSASLPFPRWREETASSGTPAPYL